MKRLATLSQLATITFIILLASTITAAGVLILAYSAANFLTSLGILTFIVALAAIGIAEFLRR